MSDGDGRISQCMLALYFQIRGNMSEQLKGFYFSCNADKSAHDHTIFVEQKDFTGTVRIGARYKNSEPNHLYEIAMDANDLAAFGQMCIDLAAVLPNLDKDV